MEEYCGRSLAVDLFIKFNKTCKPTGEEWKMVSSFWAKRDSRRECHENSLAMYRTKKEGKFREVLSITCSFQRSSFYA